MKIRKNFRMGMLKAIAAVLIVASFTGCGGDSSSDKVEQKSIVEEIQSDKGYIRVVSQEEYDFYKYFIERDLAEEIEADALDVQVKAYINEVNAVFYLGDKFDLYEPYSFDLLKIRMEQENQDRKRKLEAGEIVYGLEQFTLQTYYQYERSNLETDLIAYIEEHVDSEIMEQAEAFYYENSDLFTGRESVTYEITAFGETKEVTADREQLNLLANGDRNLADFLENAEVGETYTDVQNGEERNVVVTKIINSEAGFENNRDAVIQYYIRYVLLEELIDTVAKNNPVEFNFT